MKLRFYNARILTMVQKQDIFKGEIHIENERISFVGTAEEAAQLEPKVWDYESDCGGNLLMPGFKNAHTHSAMVGFRSLADDLPLDKWLQQQIFPLEDKLTGKDQYDLTQLAILEYLTTGVTAIFEMYLSPFDIAQACIDAGMRCVQTSGKTEGGSDEREEERYQKLNNMHPLMNYRLGFHAEYTNSVESLKHVAEMAHKYQAPVYSHNAETLAEVEGCKERYGMTPTQLFDSLGMFEYGGGGYHGVYMTKEDVEIFRNRNLSIVTNPASNLKLASGIAPVKNFLDAGVNVAIGTDGAASNNCLDMFREMFLVTGLSKFRENDASVTDALEVLKMATVNGAKAMGLMDTDVLAAGKLADMILIDLNQPNMQPMNNIAKNIVYSGSKQNIKMTMIHGRILYENGAFHIGREPEEIYEKANRIIRRLTQ